MKSHHWLVLLIYLLLSACQPSFPNEISILDEGRIHQVDSSNRVPLTLLTEAGIPVQPFDRVLFNGMLLPLDQPLPDASFGQLQLRHAMLLTINSPQGQQV